MENASRTDVNALLADQSRLDALVRRLARDRADADDLAQRTLEVALRVPRATAMPLWAWIASIARNLAHDEARTRARRADREARAARPVAVETHDLERLETHRRLLAAVEELPEAQRRAVVARYLEGLPPRRIAAREGVPVRTIQTRLQRGLAALRARLGRNEPDRRPWFELSALLAASRRARSPVAPAIVVAASMLVLAGVAWVLRPQGDVRPTPIAPAVASSDDNGAPVALEAAAAGAERLPSKAVSDEESAVASRSLLRGRVIDVDGVAVPRLSLSLSLDVDIVRADARARIIEPKPRSPLGASDEHGEFALEAPSSAGVLVANGEGVTTLLAAEVSPGCPARGLLVVVARASDLSGRVTDVDGHTLKATIVARPDPTLRARLRRIVDRSSDVCWSATSDSDGRFVLHGAPLASGELRVESVGHASAGLALPADRSKPLEVTLKEAVIGPILRGRVVDAAGQPVPGAFVSQGHTVARCDENGAFALEPAVDRDQWDSITADCRTDPLGMEVIALAPGFLPGRIPARDAEAKGPSTIRLGGPALAIRGTVVDADGRVVEGARIWTEDVERFGYMVGVAAIEAVIGRSAHLSSPGAVSARDGSFQLDGLLDRPYRVAVVDRRSLAFVQTAPISAGTRDVRIELPKLRDPRRVAGKVVSANGKPLASVAVHACRSVLPEPDSIRKQTFGAKVEWGFAARADAAGRFDLGLVEADGLEFRVVVEGLETHEPSRRGSPDDLELVVPEQLHLQVDLSQRADLAASSRSSDLAELPQAKTWFEVFDREGRRLQMTCYRGHAMLKPTQMAIDGPLSEVVCVPASAVAVGIRRMKPGSHSSEEVARTPIEIGEGELTTVRVR